MIAAAQKEGRKGGREVERQKVFVVQICGSLIAPVAISKGQRRRPKDEWKEGFSKRNSQWAHAQCSRCGKLPTVKRGRHPCRRLPLRQAPVDDGRVDRGEGRNERGGHQLSLISAIHSFAPSSGFHLHPHARFRPSFPSVLRELSQTGLCVRAATPSEGPRPRCDLHSTLALFRRPRSPPSGHSPARPRQGLSRCRKRWQEFARVVEGRREKDAFGK